MILKTVFLLLTASITALTTPSNPTTKVIHGKISYYASKFEGRRTSSGQRYRANRRTAAHRTFPFGTLLEVTNKANGSTTVVKVNDRGPHKRSRVLDVSYSAAKDLGLLRSGTALVSIKVLSLGDGLVKLDEEEEEELIATVDSTLKSNGIEELLNKKRMYLMVVKDAEGRIRVDSSAVNPLNAEAHR
ncbi:septal ring lytic transglycosylase RlpA family protein [Arcicella rigui]|uniref:Probable endolytic peptidoglycan transglycosylase RlpA n=1 Tax=Arcicella rigui TaxID=797020 RepID=A0ABU5Q9F0_9BACT|nr:septal ring lytic transglycosylase RlpA family protein [Arcicella rigui]MEA5139486.1 septal ring lytic transglycosylase RlpA family protein [Arcicella rigui]